MTLHLLSFNNYYNRIIKTLDTLALYEPYILDSIENINFNPNDGVSTEQIINYEGSVMPDYVLITHNGEIVSRWFVIEGQRTRALQFKLVLYRDVISDWKDTIVNNCPMFIEKASLPANNPLIFNSENMSYNQVLQSQTLIKDPTGSAWIVGYIPRNYPESQAGHITTKAAIAKGADYETSSLADWVNFNFGLTLNTETNKTTGKYGYPGALTTLSYYWTYKLTSINFNTFVKTDVDGFGNLIKSEVIDTESAASLIGQTDAVITGDIEKTMLKEVPRSFLQKFQIPEISQNIRDAVATSVRTLDSQQEDRIRSLDGQTIYDSSNDIIYKIKVSTTYPSTGFRLVYGTPMFNAMANSIFYAGSTAARFWLEGSPNNDSFKITVREPYYNIEFEQATVDVETTISNSDTRFNCIDSPYDVFCMPYGNIQVLQNGVSMITQTSQEAAMAIAMEIAKDTGLNQSQFDIQLLPYCPALYCYSGKELDTGVIDTGSAPVDWITSGEGKVSVILWVTESNFRINIPYSIPKASTATEVKVQSECDLWRLCSPNYNGLFEFNAAKNNGVSSFQVDCTLKPYSPFIHIKPNFGGLYGINPEKDNRGLILGGDFSLPQITDAWATYQLNNKNYQEIFDRQIQNMEVKNNVQRSQEIMGAITGTITGGVSGAMAGAQAGPYGMIAGAIGGTVASAAGGIIDYQMSELLRNEAIDYSKDQFGYQLGNIQAIPNSISKTSAITYTNKLFPFIEYYTATEIEKEALRNKIKYNGMTVMTVGYMNSYLKPGELTYIKGKLIRMEGSEEDYHVVNVIASELNKGVFI